MQAADPGVGKGSFSLWTDSGSLYVRLASVSASVLTTLPAFAQEALIFAEDEGGDPVQTLVTILFFLAVLALSVTTLGVGYLSFTNWQNSTEEKKERLTFDKKKRYVPIDGHVAAAQ
ncbi:MAG: hypothetical protein AAF387_05990 [Pseudomonadota bacterium]